MVFLAPGYPNCMKQIKPLLGAEDFLEDHGGGDIKVSLSHYLYRDEGPAYGADQNHIRLIQAVEDTPDQIDELGNFLLQHARLVDELTFTIPGQPNEQSQHKKGCGSYMSMAAKWEILEFWKEHETPEAKEERREVEALKKDLRIAQDSIRDVIVHCRKAKLRVRSKAKASSGDIFLPLEEYSSRTDIRNAYGYGVISGTEHNRLMTLWELREQPSRKNGSYTDRVIEMLEVTSRDIWDAYGDPVMEYDEKVSRMHREAEQIAVESWRRELDHTAE